MIPYHDVRLSIIVFEQIMVQDGVKNGKIWMHCCYEVGQTHYTSLYESTTFSEQVFSDCEVSNTRNAFLIAQRLGGMKKSPSFLFSLCWTKNKQTIFLTFFPHSHLEAFL